MQITPEVQAKINSLPTAEQIGTMTEYKGKQVVEWIECPECHVHIKSTVAIIKHLHKNHKYSKDQSHKFKKLFTTKCITRADIIKRENFNRTSLLRYGTTCPMQHKEKKVKIQRLWQEKYGASNPFFDKSIRNRIIKTMVERYGGITSQCSPEVRKKSEQTCLKNYGVKHALQSKKLLKKAKKTCLRNNGVEFPLQNKIFRNKMFETTVIRYGAVGRASPILLNKIKQTSIEKYGADNWAKSNANDGSQAFQHKEYTLPSGCIISVQGYEPYALDYLFNTQKRNETDFLFGGNMNQVVNIQWHDANGKQHRYFPDAFDVANNTAIEVKSTWTANKDEKTVDELQRKRDATIFSGFSFRLIIFSNAGDKLISDELFPSSK